MTSTNELTAEVRCRDCNSFSEVRETGRCGWCNSLNIRPVQSVDGGGGVDGVGPVQRVGETAPAPATTTQPLFGTIRAIVRGEAIKWEWDVRGMLPNGEG